MFNKIDFKDGMIVQLDTGKKRLYWEGKFIDMGGYIPLDYYDDNLNNMDSITKDGNIDKVFLVHGVESFDTFFNTKNLTEIWSRY